jgi:hypothetical protein
MHIEETFPAIYHLQNTPTEPSRLLVIPLQPLLAQQVLVSRGLLKCQRGSQGHFNTMCRAEMVVQYAKVGRIYVSNHELLLNNGR